jgi:hypothetical protein
MEIHVRVVHLIVTFVQIQPIVLLVIQVKYYNRMFAKHHVA